VAGLLPHRPTSPNATKPVEIALGFLACTLDRLDNRPCQLPRRLQSFIKKATPWEPTPMGGPASRA
jgi:hypothetical protein